MKHKSRYMIASLLAVSSLTIQSLPVLAQETVKEESEEIEIKSAKDFKEQFLSIKEVKKEKDKEIVSYSLIEEVDETNYFQLLNGKLFYEELKLDEKENGKLIEEIDKMLVSLKEDKEHPFDFDQMLEKAVEINEKIEKEKEESEKDESDEKESEDEKDSEDKKDSDDKESEEKESEDEKDLDEDQDESEDKKDVEDKKDSEEKKDSDDKKSEEKDSENKKDSDDKESDKNDSESKEEVVEKELEPQEFVLQNPLSIEQTETKIVQEQVAPANILSYSVETKQEMTVKPQAVSKQNTISSTSQTFINTYLTSQAGYVYTKANSLNYNNILNGLSAWNKLSSAQRNEVNTVLRQTVGKTYQKLLQEAQTIKAGGVVVDAKPQTYVNTGVQNSKNLWTLLCAICASGMCLLFKQNKNKK
ncbi:MAG: hypothetical protein PUH10_02965 [Erysipelotrichaceae bacterium]|uniref:hypothetical protein n=1 Tax=Floccifex sp. TaxID=2815810 RepID=UPI002A764470|nr:hypothetical protein [Floccifex sp.]MDD7280936.1 hypothetical protein [Erysipelotrichaceae bacterium]MDY2957934.1 hypothetical protein [Floccifex sp.]